MTVSQRGIPEYSVLKWASHRGGSRKTMSHGSTKISHDERLALAKAFAFEDDEFHPTYTTY
jgi:hypothetical protein